jgi:hypothetical protein
MRAWLLYLVPWLASACLAFAADSCFLNTNWQDVVAGKPIVLAWPADGTTFWDVLLNADVRTQATPIGPVAQNVTQPGVVWIPPPSISESEPERLFAFQLWDLGRGTTCNSPSFRIRSNGQPAEQLPPGEVVRTRLAIGGGNIIATATVAKSFSKGIEASYSSSIPTSTSTEAPKKDEPPPTNVAAIVVGVVFGTLMVLLIVLSVLLWRARRKRARQHGSLLAGEDGAGAAGHHYERVGTPATPTLAMELDSKSAPAEMQAVPACQPPAEMQAVAARQPPVEMPAPMMPVELPAEVPSSLLPPDRCQSLVSDLTIDSRASSPERFPVSPTIPTRRASQWKG